MQTTTCGRGFYQHSFKMNRQCGSDPKLAVLRNLLALFLALSTRRQTHRSPLGSRTNKSADKYQRCNSQLQSVHREHHCAWLVTRRPAFIAHPSVHRSTMCNQHFESLHPPETAGDQGSGAQRRSEYIFQHILKLATTCLPTLSVPRVLRSPRSGTSESASGLEEPVSGGGGGGGGEVVDRSYTR